MLDFIKEWTEAYCGIPATRGNWNWSLVSYVGESKHILRRWKQENDRSKVDGAKLNWIASQFLDVYEIMFAHVPDGTGRRFECLLMEGLMLTAQVGVAHLIGDIEYIGLASSGDGLNEMNGGRAWINDTHWKCSMEEILSRLRSYGPEHPNELVMTSTSTLVPLMIWRFLDLESQQSDISRYWLGTPPENITVNMLHRYISSLGGKAPKATGDETTYEGGDETQDRTRTRAILPSSTKRLSQSSRDSSVEDQSPLITEEILKQMKAVPPEKVIGRDKWGKQRCRTEELVGDKCKWEPCQSGGQSDCEGHCKKHYTIYKQHDSNNWKKWKKPKALSAFEVEDTLEGASTKAGKVSALRALPKIASIRDQISHLQFIG